MSQEELSKETEPFALFDCSLARYALGRSCSNLRELLDAVRGVADMVLDHHMRRCALEDHFELSEFPNDFARWCWESLGDRVLAEKLALIDPYQLGSSAELRGALVNVLEDRIWGMDRIPWCRPGLELHLTGSRLIAYDTGERFASMASLAEALPKLSVRSLYYHVHEARRRPGSVSDDFSAWLESMGYEGTLLEALRGIDFYFLNLKQLRGAYLEVFRRHLPEPQVVFKVTA